VLYDVASDYPKGLAEFFKQAWEKITAGSVVAFESFTTKDADFSSQLTKIIKSGAEVLFTPQYYNEVALIVQQAHELGLEQTDRRQRQLGFGRDRGTSAARTATGCSSAPTTPRPAPPGATKAFIDRYSRNTATSPMMWPP
jgi:branched-chain amino acid transport system substrate-binding protein